MDISNPRILEQEVIVLLSFHYSDVRSCIKQKIDLILLFGSLKTSSSFKFFVYFWNPILSLPSVFL